METEETTNGEHAEPEGRRTPRKFTEEDKDTIIAELNECATSKEARAVMIKHRVQLHQVQRWREQASGRATKPKRGRKKAPEATEKPARKAPIGAGYVLQYLESLEERIEALEAKHKRITSALGGDE